MPNHKPLGISGFPRSGSVQNGRGVRLRDTLFRAWELPSAYTVANATLSREARGDLR
jgi:hypothetical protein